MAFLREEIDRSLPVKTAARGKRPATGRPFRFWVALPLSPGLVPEAAASAATGCQNDGDDDHGDHGDESGACDEQSAVHG
jgi:hypothetical protein